MNKGSKISFRESICRRNVNWTLIYALYIWHDACNPAKRVFLLKSIHHIAHCFKVLGEGLFFIFQRLLILYGVEVQYFHVIFDKLRVYTIFFSNMFLKGSFEAFWAYICYFKNFLGFKVLKFTKQVYIREKLFEIS